MTTTPARTSPALRGSPKLYGMKKSINLWAFPYPASMSLGDCLRWQRKPDSKVSS